MRSLALVGTLLAAAACERPTVSVFYPAREIPAAGLIGAVLEHSDIFDQLGVEARVVGGDLAKPPPGGWRAYDVILTGESAPIRMIAGGYRGRILATLGSGGRIGLATPSTTIRSLADLRGKRIGTLRSTSLHRQLLAWLGSAGLSSSDVEIVFLPVDAFTAEKTREVRGIDAIMTWDPALYELGSRHGYRVIAQGAYWISVVAGDRILASEQRRSAVCNALRRAAERVRSANAEAMAWYRRRDPTVEEAIRSTLTWNRVLGSGGSLSTTEGPYEELLASNLTFLRGRGTVPRDLTVELLLAEPGCP